MKLPPDSHEKMMTAYQMLGQDMLSISMFENIRILLKGVHPEIDKKLEICSKALSILQKIQSGDVVTLTAEHLPEDTEKKKKRKKTWLFFIQTIKDLQSEMKRIDSELRTSQSSQNQFMSWGRIVKFAKGPFGLTTLVALVVIGISVVFIHSTAKSAITNLPSVPTKVHKQVEVIMYNNKQLPLSGLYIGHGTDCDSPHYHAINGAVTALDGTVVVDPEGCGFGKVKDTSVVTSYQ